MTNTALSPAPRPDTASEGALICVVVDDSMIDRYLICHTLKAVFDDSVTLEFATAAEARSYLERGEADIILADRILPDGDGAEFALAPPEGTAALLLSGVECNELAARLERDGRARFLHKDDLNAETLSALLVPLMHPAAEVVPLRPATGGAPEPVLAPSQITRGLRLLRTIRSNRGKTGGEEVAELLSEVEGILVSLKVPRDT
ncbi:response regulator [Pseudooceanicola sp. LIPI14-2-Ac024]|uniref:response regulator n=1 Tax=Pseudooceanicola sp. LIPI14-2-Ac024 TaxID=3344875 RepID=UPI0035D129C7